MSSFNTPYRNTISVDKQAPYPGDVELEWRIRSLVRWNAMAMVVRANRKHEGIGGHISTFASAATLYEVAFNHFFRGKNHPCGGDQIFFQGHAAPGIYARAFLEERLSLKQLDNFRRELQKGGGLSSYPHPRLMPDFWEFPSVSMGLAPLMGVYQARFNKYLEHRGLLSPPPTPSRHPIKRGYCVEGRGEGGGAKVWVFCGDGEMDEPESTAGLTLASRENLNNLIFVVNCNLQRLDGPVRGNGKIIQELESLFLGAGWKVIKLVWGRQWDPLLAKDKEGVLLRRMNEEVDGQYQKYAVSSGAYIREHFFGTDPRLLQLVADLGDDELRKLGRGGHDPEKVYAAYQMAFENKTGPTVILAKTLKGYGLGEAGEGKNITHQQKKLNEDELREFRTRFGIPISDEEVAKAPFYSPPKESEEIRYLKERRKVLGGFVPTRKTSPEKFQIPSADFWKEFHSGSSGKAVSTTMVFVRILSKLLRDPKLGRSIVPIVPDEARTFGMEGLFAQYGIYSPKGQLYDPVDSQSLLYYKESAQGQLLEEGITEAGAVSSFIAAGTTHATHHLPLIPFYTFYSMFGLQRIGDLVWAASDMRCKGFLMGATAGRTTLAGEGLQHQDGQSHLFAYAVPSLKAYDPAFAYELAVILEEGLKELYERDEENLYYITLMNENYPQAAMPKGSKEGILKGLYLFSAQEKAEVNLFGSGAILNEVIRAAEILENEHKISCNVWSITSYKTLYTQGCETEKYNREHPDKTPQQTYLQECLKATKGIYVLASDYMRALPDSLARWFPRQPVCLGTEGWGLSETRASLRKHFGVDAESIVKATLYELEKKLTG